MRCRLCCGLKTYIKRRKRVLLASKESGAALLMVLLLTALLFSMGSILFRLGFLEFSIADNQLKAVRAHYMAEAGIEAALDIVLLQEPGFRGNFTGNMGDEDSFQVEVAEGDDRYGAATVQISSKGVASNAQDSITLVFEAYPEAGEGAVSGRELGWYSGQDGYLITREEGEEEDEEVIVDFRSSFQEVVLSSKGTSGGIGLASGDIITLQAPALHFTNEGQSLVIQGGLVLNAEVIVVKGRVLLDDNNALTLQPYNNNLMVYLLEDITNTSGKTLVKAGAYEFGQAFNISNNSSLIDISSHRVPFKVPGTLRWY